MDEAGAETEIEAKGEAGAGASLPQGNTLSLHCKSITQLEFWIKDLRYHSIDYPTTAQVCHNLF